MTRKIITSFVYPPIPARDMDWQAVFEGDEPSDNGHMMVGRGATELEAIRDLKEQFSERDANARLIAAAPELYEALRDFFENPDFVCTVGGNPIRVEAMMARARAALSFARAALAKETK